MVNLRSQAPPARLTTVLDRERAALVIVDVQEGFRPAVLDFDRVARNAGVLAQGARTLGLPLVVTEQYPKGKIVQRLIR